MFYQPLLQEGIYYLDPDESKHCTKVLRKKQGDTIRLTDGLGFFYAATITQPNPQRCLFNVVEKTAAPQKDFHLHIAISPTKNPDRIEWFVEKAVEIGVDAITFVECDHTERTHLKVERLEKLSVSAMKQSVKATLPKLSGLTTLQNFLNGVDDAAKFIAYVDHTNPIHLQQAAKPHNNYVVLIGPEGDFSKEELDVCLQKGFQKVNLGPSRLRTETAGIVACHTLNLINT
nr:16S rRNA (uracil(1498)-N(3))-methyltransferase [Chryseolinea lacunae]